MLAKVGYISYGPPYRITYITVYMSHGCDVIIGAQVLCSGLLYGISTFKMAVAELLWRGLDMDRQV